MANPAQLIDKPDFLSEKFQGYMHLIDPTVQNFNVLAFPSINCSIPIGDKIIPDKGKTLLGQAFTENVPVIGNKEKFKNMGGLEMEVRVWPSASNVLRDVIEIYYTNDKMLLSGVVGVFQVGETVTGGTSGATGIISNILNTVLTLTNITGTFLVGETITGQSSGATANVITSPISVWQQITENTNPLPRGLHEYYFDEWFDTNVDPSLTRRLPRLIWVNGYETNTNPKTGLVFSWTGGVAIITNFTATNILIDPSLTWRSLGFTEDALGNAYVVVNGVSYQLANPADLDTNSIDVTSTAGIGLGNIATAKIESDVSPIPFDVCRANKGYMFYGNWTSRELYQSNAFNRPATLVNQTYNSRSGLNDAVFTGTFTANVEEVFSVTIDSVVQSPIFTGTGANGLVFDLSGYTQTGDTNTYKVIVYQRPSTSNNTIIYDAATGIFWEGETVTGGTSGANGVVVYDDTINKLVLTFILGAPFLPGEIITGGTSGITATVVSFGPNEDNFLDFFYIGYKNDVNVVSGALQGPTGAAIAGPFPLFDGLTFDIPLDIIGNSYPVGAGPYNQYQGYLQSGDTWEITITDIVDTFSWSLDGDPQGSHIPVDTAPTLLADGVSVEFLQLTGHTIGDTWTITGLPDVDRAWVNFYYNLPIRKPGEGYKYRLPSNFWTMDTQEESMYVNGSYGEWSFISTILSGDLQSEDVSLTPLKQVGASKVLYPYLTSHINDDLIYITVDKKLDTLGRKIYMEKPQTSYLSEDVDLDFQESSFVGGRMKYINKRIFISSPENGIMHCFDTHQNYWQPPKVFPEIGILSIFGNDLICHSDVRNQSYSLFTNTNGDNGQNYEVVIRTPYQSFGDRWQFKNSNMSFTEGYIQGNPPLTHNVYLGVEGCAGIFEHEVEVTPCNSPSRAPLGDGFIGSHPLGSDVGIEGNYFQEIYPKYAPNLLWYFLAIEIKCSTKTHSYSILSMGMNAINANIGNNQLKAPSTKVL